MLDRLTHQGQPTSRRRPAHLGDLMERIRAGWIRWVQDDDGQGLAEYALILALIAIIAIVALIFLGGQISKIISDVGHSV
jgi:pilus assembly protein Flp/PilA